MGGAAGNPPATAVGGVRSMARWWMGGVSAPGLAPVPVQPTTPVGGIPKWKRHKHSHLFDIDGRQIEECDLLDIVLILALSESCQ